MEGEKMIVRYVPINDHLSHVNSPTQLGTDRPRPPNAPSFIFFKTLRPLPCSDVSANLGAVMFSPPYHAHDIRTVSLKPRPVSLRIFVPCNCFKLSHSPVKARGTYNDATFFTTNTHRTRTCPEINMVHTPGPTIIGIIKPRCSKTPKRLIYTNDSLEQTFKGRPVVLASFRRIRLINTCPLHNDAIKFIIRGRPII
ncbi:hypothetical protein BDN67DRAFT_455409 [Paxillus ammoniavirescens]|nr:hypothetical protein BDN67DRAFT_455409 [Paxillus ammoniavirescens]